MATSYDVSGMLASGGEFHATPSMIEVTYPGTDKPPVAIDIGEVSGVRRRGSEVTLIRGGRETALRTTALVEAGRLEALVRHHVEAIQAEEFEHQLIRLYTHGYQVVAMTPKIAQLRRPKKFNYLIASLLLLLAVIPAIIYLGDAELVQDEELTLLLAMIPSVVPAVIYLFYFLSLSEPTALVILEDSGEVVVRQV